MCCVRFCVWLIVLGTAMLAFQPIPWASANDGALDADIERILNELRSLEADIPVMEADISHLSTSLVQDEEKEKRLDRKEQEQEATRREIKIALKTLEAQLETLRLENAVGWAKSATRNRASRC